MDLGVRGATFILIGASRGIGAMTAKVLGEEGAHLVLVARNAAGLRETASAIPGGAQTVLTICGDAAVPGFTQDVVEQTKQRFGRIDGMGIFAWPAGGGHGLLDASRDIWDFHHSNGLMLAVEACKAVLPVFIEQTSGSLLLTAAYSIRAPKPKRVAYSSLKAALASVAKNIAIQYGSKGIRCNVIAPGIILDTTEADPVEDALRATERYRQVAAEHGMDVALGRAGLPSEFAAAAAFLLSARASYISGAALNIDGGTNF